MWVSRVETRRFQSYGSTPFNVYSPTTRHASARRGAAEGSCSMTVGIHVEWKSSNVCARSVALITEL
jgi:hypothetical protein